MIRKFLYLTGVVTFSFLMLNSCSKEDRNPRLIVHVHEEDGTPAVGAEVRAWPGDNAGQPGSVINEAAVDQTVFTDEFGNSTFHFEHSLVLDIDVDYVKTYLDELLNVVVDTFEGRKVVKIEVVRQRDEKNDFNESVEVEKIN